MNIALSTINHNIMNITKKETLISVGVGISLILGLIFLPGFQKAEAVNLNTTIPLCEITRNLKVGLFGEDVWCLQRYLNWSGNTVAVTGAGSPGSETTYFGIRTQNAVKRWQEANAATVLNPVGLFAGTGFWGPSSFNSYVNIVWNAFGINFPR